MDTTNLYEDFNDNDGIKFPVQDAQLLGLTYDAVMHYAERLSGKDVDGKPKSVVGYQFFADEDSDDSDAKNTIYSITKGVITLSMCKLNQNFYVLDVAFPSASEPELKLLWGRLQQFRRKQITEPEKTWLFYLNIMETGNISTQSVDNDVLLICNVFNPTLFLLTREAPEYLCEDRKDDESSAMYGGNVVRMLIPTPLLTFQENDEIDTGSIKADLMTEIADTEYIDSHADNNSWVE